MVAHAATLTEGVAEHADVIFPCEAYAEKEGTVTHPDGRVQRLRPAIGRPARRARRVAGAGRAVRAPRPRPRACSTAAMATAQLVEAVGFYAGLTLGGDRRRRRALAGPRRRLGAGETRDQAPFELESRQARRRPRRPPAPGHVPLALGLARGGSLPRAALPGRRPARRAVSRRRRAPGESATASGWRCRSTARGLRADGRPARGDPARQRLPGRCHRRRRRPTR